MSIEINEQKEIRDYLLGLIHQDETMDKIEDRLMTDDVYFMAVQVEEEELMQDFVDDAVAQGAKLVTGGKRIGNQGYFHQPTVLSEVPTDAEIMNEEPFGPVAILNPMAGEDAMIEEANRLPYGLAAYAWTEDPARRRRLAAEVEAGMLAINTGGVSAVDAPFGGVKWSGYGSEDGREGVMACMVPKAVHEG